MDRSQPDVIPTGFPTLDTALGIGGWPRRAISQVFGPAEEVGAVARQCIRAAWAAHGCVFVVDCAGAYVPDPSRPGVEVKTAGDVLTGLAMAADLARGGKADRALVVLFLPVPTPTDLTARGEERAVRKLLAALALRSPAVLVVSPHVQRSGVTFGSPWVTGGGNAWKFYASVRVEVRLGGRAYVVKNKLAPPFTQAALGSTAEAP